MARSARSEPIGVHSHEFKSKDAKSDHEDAHHQDQHCHVRAWLFNLIHLIIKSIVDVPEPMLNSFTPPLFSNTVIEANYTNCREPPGSSTMSDPKEYTVGWICAVETEYVAAQEFLDEEHPRLASQDANDNNIYTLGSIGQHKIAVACLPDGDYGLVTAANVARDMLRTFPNVRFGLMVGIGGGVPTTRDIRLGDIVVSSLDGEKGAVFQYDFGKTIQDKTFKTTKHQNAPPPLLRAAVQDLKIRYRRRGNQIDNAVAATLDRNPRLQEEYRRPDPATDRLYNFDFVHVETPNGSCASSCGLDANLVPRDPRPKYDDNSKVHYGLIASGNQLMKDAVLRDCLAREKDVLCFEMEAAGLMNHFNCLVIRGICDYSDSHKNNDWQGYAAMAAAAYAKDLLNTVTPSKVEAEKKISELLSDS